MKVLRHEKIQEHLKLGEGLISSIAISESAAEYEIRNALSRAYYGVLHACVAWLALKGTTLAKLKKINHKKVQGMIEDIRDKDSKLRLVDICRLRVDADYGPRMFSGRPYFGNLDKFRVVASSKIELALSEFEFYAGEIKRSIGVTSE